MINNKQSLSVEEFEAVQRSRNRISWRTKIAELSASPYPNDDLVRVPIRFGDIRCMQDALSRLDQAAADLRTVGDDYPGSSCHKWCHERADAALDDALRFRSPLEDNSSHDQQ